MQMLVIGASGYLGKHVYTSFKHNYDNVIGTYCSHQTDQTMHRFDINRDNIESLNVPGGGYAIICAAESKYDACKIKMKESFQINVTSTIKLIEKLKQMNYFIVFCSTDSVYDGIKGHYRESDQAEPVNEYGKMKLYVEQYIEEHCPDACVFRLSKMVGDIASPRDTLSEWKKMAMNKQDIYCIRNNYFSPVYVEDVVNCIEIACKKKIRGVFNLCGDKTYSRADLCASFLTALGIETNIYEKNVEEFGFSAARPLNVGMCNQKIKNALEYKFKSMEEIYVRYMDR